MVTKTKEISTPMVYYRLGTILIWLGVLVWAPFIYLRVIGEKPVFLWFLPLHLIGVVGGSRLRAIARKQMSVDQPKGNALHKMGHGLIIAGICVWLPYVYLKVVMGQAVEVMDFLPFHLIGVLGGVLVHIVAYLRERTKKD